MGAFLAQRGERAVFPSAHRQEASAVLLRFARNDLGPFSTAVAIEVMRLAPPTAPRGLLREIFEDPPFGLVCLRVLALDAMAAGPSPDDLAFFRTNLLGSEPWISRRAIRALARDPGSVRELAEALIAAAPTIDPEVSRELARVLGPSGLSRDERLVSALLDSPDDNVVASALRALTMAETGDDTSPAVVGRLARLASSDGPAGGHVRSEALSALGASGEAGVDAVREIVRNDQLAPSDRLRATQVLADHDPETAAASALALIPLLAVPRWVVAAAAVAAQASPPARIRAAVEQWQAAHPAAAAAVNEELHATRSEELQTAIESWEDRQGRTR